MRLMRSLIPPLTPEAMPSNGEAAMSLAALAAPPEACRPINEAVIDARRPGADMPPPPCDGDEAPLPGCHPAIGPKGLAAVFGSTSACSALLARSIARCAMPGTMAPTASGSITPARFATQRSTPRRTTNVTTSLMRIWTSLSTRPLSSARRFSPLRPGAHKGASPRSP